MSRCTMHHALEARRTHQASHGALAGLGVRLAIDDALARTIVVLGEMLGLTTVAEGIERAAQHRHLGALGCELGQGHHFAPPLDASAAADFLAGATSHVRRPPTDAIWAPA